MSKDNTKSYVEIFITVEDKRYIQELTTKYPELSVGSFFNGILNETIKILKKT